MEPADVGGALMDMVPGQEVVTLYIRVAAPANDSFTTYPGITVRRRPLKKTYPAEGNRILPVVTTEFHLYRPALTHAGVPVNTIPRYQDYHVDARGVKWIYWNVDAESLVSFIKINAAQQT